MNQPIMNDTPMTRIRLFLLIALSLMASHVALAQRFAVGQL